MGGVVGGEGGGVGLREAAVLSIVSTLAREAAVLSIVSTLAREAAVLSIVSTLAREAAVLSIVSTLATEKAQSHGNSAMPRQGLDHEETRCGGLDSLEYLRG